MILWNVSGSYIIKKRVHKVFEKRDDHLNWFSIVRWKKITHRWYFITASSTPAVSKGFCLNKDGNFNRDRFIFGFDIGIAEEYEIAEDCLKRCYAYKNAKGCEWHSGGLCQVQTNNVVKGNGNAEYKCWVFPGKGILQPF